ncbi:uncharacterized protein LOC124359672 [Homalodisca vitripennis]|uniref:uncharacterized protein LOC124359672 n=1 Tax=Homalodisca vitripennis TaxID=197043 RepID=UPI001EEB6A4F|nr:uncharacterized protein LOC124359672 [Homalodisca vitripennis]
MRFQPIFIHYNRYDSREERDGRSWIGHSSVPGVDSEAAQDAAVVLGPTVAGPRTPCVSSLVSRPPSPLCAASSSFSVVLSPRAHVTFLFTSDSILVVLCSFALQC